MKSRKEAVEGQWKGSAVEGQWKRTLLSARQSAAFAYFIGFIGRAASTPGPAVGVVCGAAGTSGFVVPAAAPTRPRRRRLPPPAVRRRRLRKQGCGVQAAGSAEATVRQDENSGTAMASQQELAAIGEGG